MLDKKLKIGITCYPTYGGSGVLATELGVALAKKGHEIHFITSSLPYRLSKGFQDNLYFHPVEMMDYPLFGQSPYAVVLSAKMAEVFRNENLDLIHVHYAIPHATSAILARDMVLPKKMPIVTTLHGTDITLVGKDPSFSEITKYSIEKSDFVTTVSDYMTKATYEQFDLTKKIHRIYNFVDTKIFDTLDGDKPCSEAHFGFKGETVFIHISNFREVKRPLDVLHIFNNVHQANSDTKLLLVGDGPLYSECRKKVKEYGLLDHVLFLGKQEDVVSILHMSHVMLFPSEVESFGLAPLEAMACGIPVIASNSGGVPEVVKHGECGYLADVGDIETMSKYAIELSNDCQKRDEMGAKGRQIAEKYFSPEQIISEYEEIYRQATI